MLGGAHREHDVVAALDLDRLGAGAQRALLARVAPGVALQPLDVEVGDVGAEVGEAPRDVGVVADDHAGHSREREPGHVVGTLGSDRAAVQPDLHPHPRHRDAEVRVVGQQWRSGGRVLAGDDPGVAADSVTTAEPGRHPTGALSETAQAFQACAHAGTVQACARRSTGRQAGVRARRALLEDPVDDLALRNDGRVHVEGVRREQLVRAVTSDGVDREHPVDLVLHVAAQVPRHRLEPGERVDLGPQLGGVVEPACVEHGVLEGDLGRAAVGQVGVDTVGVGTQRHPGVGVQQRQLALGDRPPPHGAHVDVGLHGVLAEQLGQPPSRGVAAHVHLEEPLLGVHEALGEHQVLGGVRIDLWDAVVVAYDVDPACQPGHLDRAAGLRERALHQHDPGEGRRGQHQHERDRDVRREPQRLGQHPEPAPPQRRSASRGGL